MKIKVVRKYTHRWQDLQNGQIVEKSEPREQVLFKGSEAAFNQWQKTNQLRATDEVIKNFKGAKVDHGSRTKLTIGGIDGIDDH